MNFKEGEEYEFSELPDSDMTHTGNLEDVGDGKLVARYGDTYVEFEYSKIRCTDVTRIDDL